MPDGGVVEEFRLNEAEFHAISTGCAGGSIGVLASLAIDEADRRPALVASLGADGVLMRDVDGSWVQTPVLSAPPAKGSDAESAASIALLAFGPVLALALWLIERRRWPSWKAGLGVVALGWIATICSAGAISLLAGPDTDPTRVIGRVAVAGMIITTVAAIIVARRPLRERPPATWVAPPP